MGIDAMVGLETVGRWLLVGVEGIALFLAASTLFDVVHFILHRFLKSRFAILRRLGLLHQAHHDFYTDRLQFDARFARANLIYHVIPEYANQVLFTLAGYFLVGVWPVVVALVIETFIFAMVVIRGGMDEHHIEAEARKTRRNFDGGLFVTADYHSLHHIYPDRFFSSYVTLFDRLMGTACQVAGRKVAITGASGAFGQAMARRLEREGAIVTPLKHGVDFTAHDASAADEVLLEADILVLAHGAKGDEAMAANCDSFVTLIERFRSLKTPPSRSSPGSTSRSRTDRDSDVGWVVTQHGPPATSNLLGRDPAYSSESDSSWERIPGGLLSPTEVWAVGSEIECHPSFGDPVLKSYRESKVAYAKHARRYYADRDVIYRHIVPSAFRSKMGPGLISGDLAANWAWFLISRGFRYVPVTYTGIAVVNYFKFLIFTRPSRKPVGQGRERKPSALTSA